ncbi:MAG: tRNA uridine-5-carboxymethylaminomethyl(34) synthesis GTPase MnmE [Deinococcales bacterium]
MLAPLNDTIVAIITAPGSAAVGIVRLSGETSFNIAAHLFKPKGRHDVQTLAAGRFIYGHIYDEAELIDEALLLSFRNPHSYTGQNIIELQCHGGPAVLRKVLELCLKQGARLAGPGEFSLRAYLNERIDLLQAESVLAMINAHSERARHQAALGLSKRLSEAFDNIQSDIIRVYSAIQAYMDYPEEGLERADIERPLLKALEEVDRLLATAKAASLLHKGARLALIGRPNAGKSSLLNALLGYERSIVSNTPGTTRDYLEAAFDIDGIPIIAIDTAGIRQTTDDIEALGVKSAQNIAEHADLNLILIDSSEIFAEDMGFYQSLEVKRSLYLASKSDLPAAWQVEMLSQKLSQALGEKMAIYSISTKDPKSIDQLKSLIGQKLLGEAASQELWLSSERHRNLLNQVKDSLERALDAPDDLAALDLQEALQYLAQITGRSDIAEETLAAIFAQFCVGK